MIQLAISMPPALQDWVETRLAQGDYADAADYLRDLVRRDRDAAADETAWLRARIDEGLASTILDEEPEQIIEDIIGERRARRG